MVQLYMNRDNLVYNCTNRYPPHQLRRPNWVAVLSYRTSARNPLFQSPNKTKTMIDHFMFDQASNGADESLHLHFLL